MLTNFGSNTALPVDACQEIHFRALNNFIQGRTDGIVPDALDFASLIKARDIMGSEILLFHPDHIEELFNGVTLSIFLTVKKFYCSKLLRSPQMVSEIINKMLVKEGKIPLRYEAIWSICAYLWNYRQEKIRVMSIKENENWFAFRLSPNIRTVVDGKTKAISIVCVANALQQAVIAYRVTIDQRIIEDFLLTIYDALVFQRRPSVDSPDGLVWKIPARILVADGLPIDKLKTLNRVGIETISFISDSPELINKLRGNWDEDLKSARASLHELSVIFNNYLKNVHGYDLLKQKKYLRHEYRRSRSYRIDPADIFPILREHLPLHQATIDGNGEIIWNNHHYQNELLSLWTGSNVNIRLSEESPRLMWVYWGTEMIGRAESRRGSSKATTNHISL